MSSAKLFDLGITPFRNSGTSGAISRIRASNGFMSGASRRTGVKARTLPCSPRPRDRSRVAPSAPTRTSISASALMNAVEAFSEWPMTLAETLSRYVEDNDLSWLTGEMPPEYS